MKIHIDDVMDHACEEWTLTRVAALFGGEKEVDALIALGWDIAPEDILHQAHRVLPSHIRRRATELTVTRCVTNHALKSSIDDWAQKWLSGEDRTKESARAAAAWAAAAWAAEAAAWAAEAAAWAAEAEAAAWAAEAAARAAEAWAAEAEAERKLQIEDLKQAIKELES